MRIYQVVLGRVPDSGGLDFSVNELTNGIITREQLVITFSEAITDNNITMDPVDLWQAA